MPQSKISGQLCLDWCFSSFLCRIGCSEASVDKLFLRGHILNQQAQLKCTEVPFRIIDAVLYVALGVAQNPAL